MKKNSTDPYPIYLTLLEYGSISPAIGFNIHMPPNIPTINPPKWPQLSITLLLIPTIKFINKIRIITHKNFSRPEFGPKAFQFNIKYPSCVPSKPKMQVDAPTEGELEIKAENKFPPMPDKKYRVAIFRTP